MLNLAQSLDDYQRAQQRPFEPLLHYVATPLLWCGFLMFLGWFQLVFLGIGPIHFGWLASFAVLALYAKIDVPRAVAAGLLLITLNILMGFIGGTAPTITRFVFLILLVATGAGIFWHHFSQNEDELSARQYLAILMTAPLVLIAQLFKISGISKEFEPL